MYAGQKSQSSYYFKPNNQQSVLEIAFALLYLKYTIRPVQRAISVCITVLYS